MQTVSLHRTNGIQGARKLTVPVTKTKPGHYRRSRQLLKPVELWHSKLVLHITGIQR